MKAGEIQEFVNTSVRYRDWEFYIGRDSAVTYLQIQFADAGSRQHGRKWMLSQFMTKSEIVQTALKAVLAAEEHEARERFLYHGKSVFGPHFDIDELLRICDSESLDVRPLADARI